MSPVVHMVSAGPGTKDYLALKAMELIKRADLIAYDDLIHPSILALSKSDAELLPIGYRANRKTAEHPILHPKLIEAAHRGKMVIRLKGGDSCLFSRIFQEFSTLKSCDIEINITPGISTGFVAAAGLGVPLTSKSISGQVVLEWPQANYSIKQSTRIVYMPRLRIHNYCRKLIAMGYKNTTNAAFVVSAGTPLERCYGGTLERLPNILATVPSDQPGIVLVGDVLEHKMKANSPTPPLKGHRIMILRLREGKSSLGEELEELGADVIYAPLVYTSTYPKLKSYLDTCMVASKDDAWLFATPESVDRWFSFMIGAGIDLRTLEVKIVTLGEKTKVALSKYGITSDLHTRSFQIEGLKTLLGTWMANKMFYFTEYDKPSMLQQRLTSMCHEAIIIPTYCSIYKEFRAVSPPPNLIITPSVKALKVSHALNFGFPIQDYPLLAMGASIADAAKTLGFQSIHQATDFHTSWSDFIVSILNRDTQIKNKVYDQIIHS